jgi:hypothetical protein
MVIQQRIQVDQSQLELFLWGDRYHCFFFDQLHIIAVTTKTFAQNGLPAEGVTRKKMLSCKQAAQKYLERHPALEKSNVRCNGYFADRE